jgi:hypothetical protein
MNTSRQAYKLEFEDRPRYCYGRLTSPAITMEGAERYLSEIADKCTRLRSHGVIIERNVDEVLSRVLAYYKIGVMDDTFPPGTAVAIVDKDAEARDRFEWAIRQTAHRIELKVFATVTEAEDWLLSHTEGCGPGPNGSGH